MSILNVHGPILTLTMNPAIDLNTSVDRVEREHKLRCGPATFDPGGGGVNVARVIERLGGIVTPLFAVGGPTGHAYREMLEAEGIRGYAIPINGTTRTNITVDEKSTNDQFRFVIEGPTVTEAEWQHSLELVGEYLRPDAYLVASGSLPPGVPADYYARVAKLAKERGARCVLDTSGAPLRAALEEGVFLVKPNRREMRDLTGSALETMEELERAARSLVEEGGAEVVALTLGADGAILASAESVIRLPSPKVKVRSAVGAGDSFVGALVLAFSQGRPLKDAFQFGLAAGAAALITPGTDLCRREDVLRLYEELSRA